MGCFGCLCCNLGNKLYCDIFSYMAYASVRESVRTRDMGLVM